MKKVYLLIALVLFIIFAYFGFKAASNLDAKSSGSTPLTLDLPGNQQNFLIVHVDDLTNNRPQLISVWGVFIMFNSPPQLMFVPLYPSADVTSKALENSYGSSRAGSLDAKFIDEIEGQYNITTSGYILVDNAAVGLFRKWLTGKDETISTTPPRSPDENRLVLYNGQEYFQELCSDFSESGAKPFFNSIKWSQVLPDHFSTNLSFETCTLAQDLLKSAGKITQCNVLSNE